MLDLLLERSYLDVGTPGKLYLPGTTIFTFERPWLENRNRISCIPEGVYPIAPGRYNKGGYDCYDVLDVPDRDLIKFHKGNSDEDLAGCIAVGNIFPYWLGAVPVAKPTERGLSIGESADAFELFMRTLNGQRARLTIRQYQPVNMDKWKVAA